MPRDTQLSRALSRPDPLLTFRWVAVSVPFGSEFGIGPEYVETFELPFNNVKAHATFFGGGYNYFPGFHDVSAFNATFYGDSKGKVLKWLMAWKGKVKDFKTGLYNLPNQYKRDWQVVLIDSAGNDVITCTLQGVWPADTGQISLDSESSTPIKINQNFSVDSTFFS